MSRPNSPAFRRSRFFASLARRASHSVHDFRRILARNYDDAVHVAHDDVAGMNQRSRADDVDVHVARRFLHGSLRGDRARERRELHGGQVGDVAHARVNHQSLDSVRPARSRQQFPEKSVGGIGMRRHDQDVSRFAHFDGGMKHQVIAGVAQHGHGRARDARGRINRPHVRQHQARAALRFVHRGGAELAEFP